MSKATFAREAPKGSEAESPQFETPLDGGTKSDESEDETTSHWEAIGGAPCQIYLSRALSNWGDR